MGSATTPLSVKAKRLLEAIVSYLATNQVDPLNAATYPTYDRLYHAVVLNAPKRVLFVGHNLRKKGLDDLNDWTITNHSIPKITGLVVDGNPSKRRPGEGFFPSHGKLEGKDDHWWREQTRRSISFDWAPYVGAQKANSPPLIADDVPTGRLPKRQMSEISRLVRDTKIAREVKAHHGHVCQLCGDRLELSPGRYYSEAHHIVPLGKPHNGLDDKSNVICVCPNCHVKLDYHAIRILPGQLTLKIGHSVAAKFINYHNQHCL
jgi:hypothetical protein